MIFNTQNHGLFYLGLVTFAKYFPNSYSSVLMFIFIYFCVVQGSHFHFHQLSKTSSHFLFLSILKHLLWPSLCYSYSVLIQRQFHNNMDMQTVYFPDLQYIFSQLFGDTKVTLFYVIVCTCLALIFFINQVFAKLNKENDAIILRGLSQMSWAFLCFYFTLTSHPFDIETLIRYMWLLSFIFLPLEIYLSIRSSSLDYIEEPHSHHSFEAKVIDSLHYTLMESPFKIQHWSHLIHQCGSALFMPHYFIATLYYLDANIPLLMSYAFLSLVLPYYYKLDLVGRWLQWAMTIASSALFLKRDYFFVYFDEKTLDTIFNPALRDAYLQFITLVSIAFVVIIWWRRDSLQHQNAALCMEIQKEQLYEQSTLAVLQGAIWLVYLGLLRPIANIFYFKKVLDVQLFLIQPLSLILFSLGPTSSSTTTSTSKRANKKRD